MRPHHLFIILLIGFTVSPVYSFEVNFNSDDFKFDLEAGIEGRYFFEKSDFSYSNTNGSVYLMPEMYREWNKGKESFTFTPYVRIDEHDENRTHGDIRELSWIKVNDDWELRTGIRKEFWGVTESQHLVDIINQTDLVENIDGEDKLGQPMINISLVRDWGVFDVFVLPGFRERTFAGEDGRLSNVIEIDTDHAEYESGAESNRTDFALRWQRSLGELEFAVSHFSGTGREPVFILNPFSQKLEPYYSVIDQTGLEAQYNYESWMFKLEMITRSGQGNRFSAATAGFEYTQVGIFGSATDLGWVVEYLFDDRKTDGPTFLERDLMLGTRWALNDANSTEALFFIIWDPQSEEKMLSLESSRRIGDSIKISLEGRWFTDTARAQTPAQIAMTGQDTKHKLNAFNHNDFVQLELVYYY